MSIPVASPVLTHPTPPINLVGLGLGAIPFSFSSYYCQDSPTTVPDIACISERPQSDTEIDITEQSFATNSLESYDRFSPCVPLYYEEICLDDTLPLPVFVIGSPEVCSSAIDADINRSYSSLAYLRNESMSDYSQDSPRDAIETEESTGNICNAFSLANFTPPVVYRKTCLAQPSEADKENLHAI